MKITRIETFPVRVPICPEFQIRGSLGFHAESPFLMLRVHTDEGVSGVGEVSCTPLWSGEDQVTAAHLIHNFLEPALVGQDPLAIERLPATMRRAVAGNPFTKSALEMAMWTSWARWRACRCTACWAARCVRPCPSGCRFRAPNRSARHTWRIGPCGRA